MKKQFYTLAALIMMSFAVQAQVGIGTPTPDATAMLDIVSAAKGLLMPRMTTVQRTGITTPATGLQVYDTTTNTFWYFNGTVWVNAGAVAASTNIYNSDGTLTGTRTVNLGTNMLQFTAGAGSTGTAIRLNPVSGQQAFSQSGNGLFGIDSPGGLNGRFAVLENGNIGINWNAPTTTLEIRGGGAAFPAITGTAQSAGQYARFHDNSNLVLDMGGNGANGNWIQSTDLGSLAAIYPLMLNPNGGNVGINTTSPVMQLAVGDYGKAKDQMVQIRTAGGSLYRSGLLFGANSDSQGGAILWDDRNTTGNELGVHFKTSSTSNILTSTTRMFIQPSGNVGIGTTTPSTLLHVNGVITATKIQGPSDSRFKKNIKPIENALEKITRLGGYTYDWKDASEFPNQTLGKGHDIGVIAQEVEKQFPEAVSTNADGYKAVTYTALVPALIEAVKAQQVLIENQQIKLDNLTKEVARLKK